MKLFSKLLAFLPFAAVFFASLYHPIDSDLGWHLKYGEYFFKYHHLLRENIYSVEMPNYHWPNSSWLTDLITYSIFHNFGFIGLSIAGAVVVTFTFFFFAKAFKLSFFEQAVAFALLLFFLSPVNSVSFRGQLLSLLLLGILFFILSLYRNNQSKILFILPVIFALWSNIHGQFLFGLALFGLWIFLFLFKNTILELERFNRIELISLLGIFLASSLAVLINPFGLSIYKEALNHFSNPLQNYVAEWLPFKELSGYWMIQVFAGFLMSFGVLFLILGGKLKEKIPIVTIAFLLFAISFLVRRFTWPMYYFSMALIAPVADFFNPQSKRGQLIGGCLVLITAFALLILISNPINRIRNMSWESYCAKSTKCNGQLMEYLLKNGYGGQLLTVYDWGGWIIWNYPEIKPSIDGRMHLWRDENGYSAFSDYFQYEQNNLEINNSKYDTVLMTAQKPLYKHLKKIVSEGKWRLVYEDKGAGIFERRLQ